MRRKGKHCGQLRPSVSQYEHVYAAEVVTGKLVASSLKHRVILKNALPHLATCCPTCVSWVTNKDMHMRGKESLELCGTKHNCVSLSFGSVTSFGRALSHKWKQKFSDVCRALLDLTFRLACLTWGAHFVSNKGQCELLLQSFNVVGEFLWKTCGGLVPTSFNSSNQVLYTRGHCINFFLCSVFNQFQLKRRN